MPDNNAQQARAERLMLKIHTLTQGKSNVVTPHNPREFVEQQKKKREQAKRDAEQKVTQDKSGKLNLEED